MLVTVNPQLTLWESLLPEMCLRMPGELERVDALLDDPRSLPRSCPTSILGLVGRRCRWGPICG